MKASIRYILLAVAVLFIFSPAEARETVTVMAHGEAVKGEEADVKETARARALANAVWTAALEVAEKTRTVPRQGAEQEVLSDPLKYIVNYKILSERWVAEGDEVWGAVEEEDPYETGEPLGPPPGPGVPAPGEEQYIFDTGPEANIYAVLVEATVDATALSVAISRKGANTWSYRYLKLVILDVRDYETFASLLERLRDTASLEDISYRSFSPGKFVLSAKAAGDLDHMRTLIAEKTGGEFLVVLLEPDTIVIKAYPMEEVFQ